MGATENRSIGIVIIEAGPSPGIICLIGSDTGLEEKVFVSPIIAYNKKDKARIVRGRSEFCQVNASNPIGRNCQRCSLCPVTVYDTSCSIGGRNGLMYTR